MLLLCSFRLFTSRPVVIFMFHSADLVFIPPSSPVNAIPPNIFFGRCPPRIAPIDWLHVATTKSQVVLLCTISQYPETNIWTASVLFPAPPRQEWCPRLVVLCSVTQKYPPVAFLCPIPSLFLSLSILKYRPGPPRHYSPPPSNEKTPFRPVL